jgi:hypothetical protein
MHTFHGVRQFNNIVHNTEPVDLQRTMGFPFSIHLVVRRLRLYNRVSQIIVQYVESKGEKESA